MATNLILAIMEPIITNDAVVLGLLLIILASIFYTASIKTGFWAPTAFVGLRMSIPIFDGMYKSALVQRSRLDLEKAQNQQNDLARAIDLEVKNARNTYITARSSAENQQNNLDLAERIYDTTQIKYREGVGSSVELTQAEQGLYDAQSNYINALYNLLVAKLDYETALGN